VAGAGGETPEHGLEGQRADRLVQVGVGAVGGRLGLGGRIAVERADDDPQARRVAAEGGDRLQPDGHRHLDLDDGDVRFVAVE
jgi:hypothetical protein